MEFEYPTAHVTNRQSTTLTCKKPAGKKQINCLFFNKIQRSVSDRASYAGTYSEGTQKFLFGKINVFKYLYAADLQKILKQNQY